MRRKKRREDDLDRELRSDLELETEEQRERGLSHEDARYAAQRALGNTLLLKEDVRESWRWSAFERLGEDLRFGVRMMLRRPLFSCSAILLLALVIAANTVLFSAIDAVWFRPLPFRDPGRIVAVSEQPPRNVQWKRQMLPPADFLTLQKNNHSFETLAAAAGERDTVLVNDRAESVSGEGVTADYLPMLGIAAKEGRTFLPSDNPEAREVVLSSNFWSRVFERHDVIGQSLNVNSKAYTIVGVMPSSFTFPTEEEGAPELWTLMTPSDLTHSNRVSVVGRLQRAITPQAAASEAEALLRAAHDLIPPSDRPQGMIVRDLQAQRAEFSTPMLKALSCAVGLVLFIACMNVAGLLLGRSAERRHEMAVRYSLGAARARVVRQLLTENILLWIIAGLTGLALSVLGIKLLVPIASQAFVELPQINVIGINSRVVAHTFVVTFVTGILFGLVPAVQGSRVDIVGTLKETGRGLMSSRRMHYWRKALVASEVTFCVILLIGAGLLLKSLVKLTTQPLGFRAGNDVTFRVELTGEGYKDAIARNNFLDRLLKQLSNLPGVQSVGATTALPLKGTVVFGFSILGHPAGHNAFMLTGNDIISPDFFRTLGIPLLAGRTFTERDSERSEQVAIVNETLVRRYFAHDNPIGQRIKQGDEKSQAPWMTVVGIVGDVKHAGLDWDTLPVIFVPYRQAIPMFQPLTREMSLVVRAGSRVSLNSEIRATVSSLDRNVPVVEMEPMGDIIAAKELPSEFSSAIFGGFACMSLLLAAIGLYAIVAQSVLQRRKEIGVRIALGATPGNITGSTMREGVILGVIGAIAGLVGGLALTRLISSMLFGVTTTDASVFIAVPLLLVFMASVATLLPSLRAALTDPVEALRFE
ncbi:MAG: ABC transporter permease [Acidobacteriaceae bacterium]|nr:ABC transporter permease [Acidobacteriaceae bacterium]